MVGDDHSSGTSSLDPGISAVPLSRPAPTSAACTLFVTALNRFLRGNGAHVLLSPHNEILPKGTSHAPTASNPAWDWVWDVVVAVEAAAPDHSFPQRFGVPPPAPSLQHYLLRETPLA